MNLKFTGKNLNYINLFNSYLFIIRHMLEEVLKPIDTTQFLANNTFEHDQMFHQIKIHESGNFPDLSKIKIAIVGIAEDRNAHYVVQAKKGLQKIRTAFYGLYNHTENIEIADLGDLKLGENAYQTYQAISIIIQELHDKNIIPLIIGGTQDLTYGQFLGYLPQNKLVNIAVVDQQIDLYNTNEHIDNTSYLYEMLNNQAQRLYNISVLGYQLHLVNPLVLETLNALHFDNIRLGKFKRNVLALEPAVRHADLVSFDLRAIKHADAPGAMQQSPNGFNGIEACRLCWYAGISDHVSSIGLYEYAVQNDPHLQTAQLVAQMMAYFIEGFYQRKNDVAPIEDQSLYYTVNFSKSNNTLTFIKSKKSDRWWMLIKGNQPLAKHLERHQLVPCTYQDYLDACDEKIPERWQKAYDKLNHWNNFDAEGLLKK